MVTRFALAILALICVAQARGAEPVIRETAEQHSARLQWWREGRFGMFIHWGPVSIKGTEISWSRANSNPQCPNKGEIPVDVYDNLYKQFNPTKFDAEQWVALARDAGAKYMVLTAKHCDGFCLWDSKASDYNIMKTPFRRDVCAELAAAAQRQNMRIGWYYSPMDWRDPDCRSPRNATYVASMHKHLRELLGNYGRIDLLWFDTDGCPAPWDQDRTYALVRGLQPGIVINNRLDMGSGADYNAQRILPNADYYTPEQRIGGYDDQRPWETCMTLGTQWSFRPQDQIKSLTECIHVLVKCAGGDGNLLFNIGPMPTGEIEPRQAQRFREMGAWLAKYGESIYGTRGGPFKPNRTLASTRKGNAIYVHLLKWNGGAIVLPPIPRKVVQASVLTGGNVDVNQIDTELALKVSQQDQQRIDTIVKLVLDGPAGAMAPVAVSNVGLIKPSMKITASNIYQNDAAYGPGKAIDDDPDTRWATDGGIKQAWLELDLGVATKFTRVEIDEVYDRVRSFELQYKDGDEWKPIHKGTTIGEHFSMQFPAVTARHVRLNVLDATDGPSITELQLFP